MKGVLLSLSLLILAALPALGQQGGFMIKSGNKGLYIEHTVASKENFYSIGRIYSVHPKHLATYNALDMSKGLSVGQILRVPLSDTNFNQKTDIGTPIYYTVAEKEGLMGVSNKNNKLLLVNIRKWNHLTNDKLTPGKKLIVGFLSHNIMAEPAQTQVAKTEQPKEEIKNTDPPKEEVKKTDPPKEELKKEVTINTEEPKKEEPKNQQVILQTKEDVKEQPKEQPKEQQSMTGTGYFKSYFDQQIKENPVKKDQTVTAGIFKTISGWTDAKYYVLLDGVEPGTVIKITNPTNSKAIYAKVLGEMSGVKENMGLNLRMSNAAAAALDIQEVDKFIVRLNY